MLQHTYTHSCAYMWSKEFLQMYFWKKKRWKRDNNGVLFGGFHRRASGRRCVFWARVSHTPRKEVAVSRSSTSSAAVASILALEKSSMDRPSTIFQVLPCKRGRPSGFRFVRYLNWYKRVWALRFFFQSNVKERRLKILNHMRIWRIHQADLSLVFCWSIHCQS